MASLFIICFILMTISSPYVLTNDKLSAYEVLQEYNFPHGLLPKGVNGYEINGDELEFSVGFSSKDFTVKNFLECPRCGCGLDCGGNKLSGLLYFSN
ncbi:DUF538 domain-containing protein [Cephalotus follicularis]|uniref:DUF538 domain-containing protein n=1 Tax=Cephalotus follicularis TaxID=3775 RepID=A0A1Q3BG38_CEPFO|nr:DUF538 domain-containing protein [Cephalotus follicularis]